MEMLLFRAIANTHGIRAVGVSMDVGREIEKAATFLAELVHTGREELQDPVHLSVGMQPIRDHVFREAVAAPDSDKLYRAAIVKDRTAYFTDLGSLALFTRTSPDTAEIGVSLSSSHMPRNRKIHVQTEVVTLAEIKRMLQDSQSDVGRTEEQTDELS